MIMNLKNMMIGLCPDEKFNGISLYLFGSSIKAISSFKDIDIILIYNKKYNNINSIINLRKNMIEYWRKECDIVLDIILLDTCEEREVKFIKKTKAEIIYSK
ncbi:hypothetical protein CLBKI_03890 [Clostridium beijerinckii]|nr:hypothetical protein CLOSB_08360 [Clostridium beijerinckii]OOM57910.1 hypothetical protein CLBKI_03890 [Clostridium beijerinckii]